MMKRALIFCLVLLFTVPFCIAEEAQTHISGDFEYVLLDDGTIKLTRFTGWVMQLDVPGKLDGRTVTVIGEQLFINCFMLVEVRLPDSVTEIGEEAFCWCENLQRIMLPRNLEYIGIDAFYGCTKLAEITLPDSVKRIDKGAFAWCESLETINLPEGLTHIGEMAFETCRKLSSITLPNSLTEIETNPFGDCTSLKDVTVSPDHPTLVSRDGFLIDETNKRVVYYPCVSSVATLYHMSIPDGIAEIGRYAFAWCDFTSITIPKSVTSIMDYAFFGSYLINVTLPDGIVDIGENPFAFCSSLSMIEVSDGNSALEIVGNALYHKPEKRLVCHPMNTRNSTYEVAAGTKRIGAFAFADCKRIKRVTMPESIVSVGDYAFRSCTNLAELTLYEGAASIGDNAFDGCVQLKSVTLPKSLTKIGEEAFYDCTALASIALPDGLKVISEAAFNGCTSLSSVSLPKNLAVIDEYAFADCESLKSITLPNNLERIAGFAFWNCSRLTTIKLPHRLKSMDGNPFVGCKSLTGIVVSPSHPTFQVLGGALIYKPEMRLICYPCGSKGNTYDIPEGVKSIGDYAFYDCRRLSSVVVPSSVTSISITAMQSYITLTVERDSYAEWFAKAYKFDHVYPGEGKTPDGVILT